jgi:hydrogenase nickel incorporation protein HypA/HybF
MHESQIARNILEVALTYASEARASRVLRVRGRLADVEMLSAKALDFHFHALARGTAAEHAKLDLTLEHLRARCRACACDYLSDHVLVCPACGSTDGELLGQKGLVVESIDVEDDA